MSVTQEIYLLEGKHKEEDDTKWLPLSLWFSLAIAKDRLNEMDDKINDYRLVFAHINRLEVIKTNRG